jgi:hypothetical protein
VIHVARSLETFWFPKIVLLIWKLVADYNRLLQVQIKYCQKGDTSRNTENRCHLCFFKWKGSILISNFDSTLNFKFRMSFCQHLSVIVFDQCHLYRKKAGLQDFTKKIITPDLLNYWIIIKLLNPLRFGRPFALLMTFFVFHMPTAIFQNWW